MGRYDSDQQKVSTESADEDIRFDPDETDFQLDRTYDVSKFDVKDMEKMDLLDVETAKVDGKRVATGVSVNMTALASVVGELDVVERKMGDDWRETSWNPRVRLKYVD